MSRAIPFTVASLARAIKGVEQAGRHVVGVRPDGTLIVADKPFEPTSLAPEIEQTSPVSKSFGEYFNGGAGEA